MVLRRKRDSIRPPQQLLRLRFTAEFRIHYSAGTGTDILTSGVRLGQLREFIEDREFFFAEC